jgi:hypothetical protein
VSSTRVTIKTTLDAAPLECPNGLGGLLVHLVGDDERDDLGIDLALFDHVQSVMGPKLAGDAGTRNRVGCGDIDTRAIG